MPSVLRRRPERWADQARHFAQCSCLRRSTGTARWSQVARGLRAWWALTGSNRRHLPCKGSALPTELSARADAVRGRCHLPSRRASHRPTRGVRRGLRRDLLTVRSTLKSPGERPFFGRPGGAARRKSREGPRRCERAAGPIARPFECRTAFSNAVRDGGQCPAHPPECRIVSVSAPLRFRPLDPKRYRHCPVHG